MHIIVAVHKTTKQQRAVALDQHGFFLAPKTDQSRFQHPDFNKVLRAREQIKQNPDLPVNVIDEDDNDHVHQIKDYEWWIEEQKNG